jgi:DHA3 family tetracycline resistance protein-like MFS transporter
MGFGWTFKSGAIDAWLADEVGPERLAGSYQRGAQVARIASLAGIGAAVALAFVDLQAPVVVGGVVLVALGVLLVLVMPETGFSRATPGELSTLRSISATTRQGAG